MSKSELSCVNCLWYMPSQSVEYQGRCQRHAPRPVLEHFILTENEEPGSDYTVWPRVASDDFCGEFKDATEGIES